MMKFRRNFFHPLRGFELSECFLAGFQFHSLARYVLFVHCSTNGSLISLRVPYQTGSSLSSPLSSGSHPEPAANLSHGMFHSRLKTYLFPSLLLLTPPSHGLITW